MSNYVEKPTRQRRFCFTLNNYTEEDITRLRNWKTSSKYMILGYEVAPTTGTPHIQGYVNFKNAKTFSSIKKSFPKIHLEPAKGTDEDNQKYCSKTTSYEEYGEPLKQGKRSDIDVVRDAVKDGATIKELYEVVTSYQASKFAENYYRVYNERKRTEPPTVVWLYGSTGCGKTRWAYENYPELNSIQKEGIHFQGLEIDHEVVLLDDFRKDFCKFHILLKLLDMYPMVVNIKYGQCQWRPKIIIITSPYHPEVVYNTREDVKQLIRRIHHIIDMDDPINKYLTLENRDASKKDEQTQTPPSSPNETL